MKIVPTGQLYVCLRDAAGRRLLDGVILQPGAATKTFRSSRFRLSLGNNEVRLFVNGTRRAVPAAKAGIGYAIGPSSFTRLTGLSAPELHMSARAGIVVTGTEVLTGRVTDRNGPWLAERLRDIGVDLETIVVVGDRPDDMESALAWLARERVDLIVTSGGLGPTADDLTAAVVGRFQGSEPVLDEPLRGRIAAILEGIVKRWPSIDLEALEEGNRKQATIPLGATILEPVGTAPGLVVPPADGRTGPSVVVLPGPPSELQPMWGTAIQTDALRRAIGGHTEIRQEMLRLFGIPESEIAETLRRAQAAGVDLEALEVTTCLRRGEVEIVTPLSARGPAGLRRVCGGRARAPCIHALLG